VQNSPEFSVPPHLDFSRPNVDNQPVGHEANIECLDDGRVGVRVTVHVRPPLHRPLLGLSRVSVAVNRDYSGAERIVSSAGRETEGRAVELVEGLAVPDRASRVHGDDGVD